MKPIVEVSLDPAAAVQPPPKPIQPEKNAEAERLKAEAERRQAEEKKRAESREPPKPVALGLHRFDPAAHPGERNGDHQGGRARLSADRNLNSDQKGQRG